MKKHRKFSSFPHALRELRGGLFSSVRGVLLFCVCGVRGSCLFRAVLLFCLCLCFFPVAGLDAAESRALVKFLDESGVELSWEPYLETGRLSFGYQTVSFRLGEPWLVLDSEGKIPCEALRKNNGTLLIPEATEKVLRDIFFPHRPSGPRIGAIFIDPGHGGKDPGTIGRHTANGKTLVVNEKDVVLDTSLLLGELLKKGFPDRQIVFSRTDDTYLTLEERPEKAHAVRLREEEAIVFVSIHANASLNPKAKGYEVWYLPSTYRRNLLTEEDLGTDSREILPIMNVMREEEFTRESISLAQSILKGFDRMLGGLSENRGLKDESWFVVRKAKMPSVLVEIGFVTNPGEARLLCDRNHLRKIAQAIYSGIEVFIRQFEGEGVLVP
ncbi:MAG: N-acetylmuramoyl-L-alanine amidase [Spirochaetia bacterium]|jgi:N-acetylmuramoyl-L-alanine amidase|nr:N-acetylmuramoyl-L-alanine amidase [Spirochaetia bacterium]